MQPLGPFVSAFRKACRVRSPSSLASTPVSGPCEQLSLTVPAMMNHHCPAHRGLVVDWSWKVCVGYGHDHRNVLRPILAGYVGDPSI